MVNEERKNRGNNLTRNDWIIGMLNYVKFNYTIVPVYSEY